ncbi:MAG: hypothetical protein GY888_07070, partial [Planctomycetaceae bacterium]|nr:hypothetical protein [Planctomycetaceae bacterium]
IPGGGAFGLGLQYAQLTSYKVTPTAATAGIGATGVWSVFITLGLPIIRTSVAHGTAFDLAWQGRAQITGLMQAVQTAAQLAPLRQQLAWNRTSSVDKSCG